MEINIYLLCLNRNQTESPKLCGSVSVRVITRNGRIIAALRYFTSSPFRPGFLSPRLFPVSASPGLLLLLWIPRVAAETFTLCVFLIKCKLAPRRRLNPQIPLGFYRRDTGFWASAAGKLCPIIIITIIIYFHYARGKYAVFVFADVLKGPQRLGSKTPPLSPL